MRHRLPRRSVEAQNASLGRAPRQVGPLLPQRPLAGPHLRQMGRVRPQPGAAQPDQRRVADVES
eukprot:9266459-Heterocapsa_arctica.AAC.1